MKLLKLVLACMAASMLITLSINFLIDNTPTAADFLCGFIGIPIGLVIAVMTK